MPDSALLPEEPFRIPEANNQPLEPMGTLNSEHIKNLLSTVGRLKMESPLINQNTEEIKRLLSMVDHLTRRVESLSNQIRIMFNNASDSNGLPENPSVPVDQRPQAPLPMDSMEYSKLYPFPNSDSSYAGESYAVIDPWNEKVSPSRNVLNPVYSTTQDENSAAKKVEYLTTLSHREVGVV